MYRVLHRFQSWLDARVDRAIRLRILEQPRAAGFAMSAYADAESSGENAVFERALLRAADPELAKLIRRHQQDEIRHARMIDERRAALGLPAFTVPDHLKLIDRLSAASGDLLDLPMDEDGDVAQVYALLYVIEERAVEVFARQIDCFEQIGDPVSAETFRSINEDEVRHLKYCRAIGRRYAGSDEAFEAEVDRIRDVEARVYAATSRDFFRHLLGMGLLELPGWGAVLRVVADLADRVRLASPRLGAA